MVNEFWRAEKKSRSEDDRKVLLIGAIGTIFLLLFYPMIGKVYDEYFAPRPFVSATVEVVQPLGRIEPLVLYDADATQNVKGEWIASVYSQEPNGTRERLFSRRGPGSYTDRIDEAKLWTWDAFFDVEDGTPSPEIPKVPFVICVRYDVYASDSNIHDQSPKFCSKPFTP